MIAEQEVIYGSKSPLKKSPSVKKTPRTPTSSTPRTPTGIAASRRVSTPRSDLKSTLSCTPKKTDKVHQIQPLNYLDDDGDSYISSGSFSGVLFFFPPTFLATGLQTSLALLCMGLIIVFLPVWFGRKQSVEDLLPLVLAEVWQGDCLGYVRFSRSNTFIRLRKKGNLNIVRFEHNDMFLCIFFFKTVFGF